MKKIASIILIVMSISCLAWAQGITVTSPNGGETLVLGKTWLITWTAVNVAAKVKIQLVMPSGALKGVIDNNLASDSSPYQWTIGQTKSGLAGVGDYKIRVVTLDGSKYDASDTQFTIAEATPPLVIDKKLEPLPLLRLKFPRLAVSGIDLVPNAEGFGIIFSYKNVGDAALPKASEVPVKPNYRMLIDGKEMASGNLFIPAFAAPPGWEQWGYFGGWIVLPSNDDAFRNYWHIGETITVYINENSALGMTSHSLTLPLKPIALKYKFDLAYTSVMLDWNTRILTISLRLDGNVPAGRMVEVHCGNMPGSSSNFKGKKPAKPGNFVFSGELKNLTISDVQISENILIGVPIPDAKQVWDMDYRNNWKYTFTFVRPNPYPVQ